MPQYLIGIPIPTVVGYAYRVKRRPSINISGSIRDHRTHLWFPSGEQNCFATLLPAAQRIPAFARSAFIICPQFAEEKNKSQKLLVDVARGLSAMGFGVLLLDYAGTGDSTGSFQESTLEGRRNDIRAAIRFAREQFGAHRIGLLGVRLGASLAAEIAGSDDSVRWLALISPILDGKRYLDDLLRSSLVKQTMTQGRSASTRDELKAELSQHAIDVDGFMFTPTLCRELEQVSLPDSRTSYGGDVLLLAASLRRGYVHELTPLKVQYEAGGAIVSLSEVLCEPLWQVHGIPPYERIVEPVLAWGENLLRTVAQETASDACEIPKGEVRIQTPAGTEESVDIGLPGRSLSGILHIPHEWHEGRGDAVIFLHGWAGYRIGPHRMLMHAAREFCGAGYLGLRFDFRGRGYSSGEASVTDHASMREDANSALQYMRARFRPRHVIMLGQCVGGIAALECETADGFVLWSAPPIETGAAAHARRSWAMAAGYLRKLTDPGTWRKIVHGRVNVRMVREALFGHFRAPTAAEQPEREQTDATKKAQALLVYGEKDPDTGASSRILSEFCEKNGIEAVVEVIPGANHAFYSAAWRNEVLDKTRTWLQARFPAHCDAQ